MKKNDFFSMKMLLVVMFSLICQASFSQLLKVVDSETLKPIELAYVTSLNPVVIAETNSNGLVDLQKFTKSDKIEIRHIGYVSQFLHFNELKNSNFVVRLVSSDFTLDQVVVSGTRWNQASSRIPQKIFNLNQETVELLTPQTAADLLSTTGKVFIQKSQMGGGSPMIRGFATNRLLYTVDGVRMNTAIFRSGNLQNVISLDPFAIENSEVLFGPGSVIYGSDAIGGVMSFNTLKPQFSLSDKPIISGKTNARISSANNEKTYHFDANIGWKKVSILTSFTSFNYGDLKQGRHGSDFFLKKFIVQNGVNGKDQIVANPNPLVQSPSGYSQMNLTNKIAYRPNQNWTITLANHYSETSQYPRYDRNQRMEKDGVTPTYGEWNYGPQIWSMTNLEVTHSLSNPLYDQLTARLAYQQFEESRINRNLNSTDRKTKKENVAAYSANVDFKKTFAKKHSIYYGVEWVQNDVTSKGTKLNLATGESKEMAPRYAQATWKSLALYTNLQFRLSEKWTLQTGVRYNHFAIDGEFNKASMKKYNFPSKDIKLNNGAVTGSLGAVYRPDRSWILSTNLSSGFRSPNVDDMGKVSDPAPNTVVVPNPDLKSEYAINADISVAKVFANLLKLDVTAYYTVLNNALSRSDYQLNGKDSIMYNGKMCKVQAIQNVDKAFIYGVQFGAELKLPYNFMLLSDLNFQKGIEKNPQGVTSPARHAAPFYGNVKLRYKRDKLTLLWYANFQGERLNKDMPKSELNKRELYALDADGNVYAQRWYTLNVKANYKFTDKISLTAGVENITDRRYRPYASGISAAGRNFVMSAKIDL